MSVASKSVPLAFVTGIIGLGLGIGGGIVLANFIEKEKEAKKKEENPFPDDMRAILSAKGGAPGVGISPRDGKEPGKGGSKGAGGGKDGGGFFGPKMQLTTLVTKLDVLTKKPLSVELTADQKKQIQEQLAGVENGDTLADAEAQAKLDAIMKLVEGHKAALADAGFRWPAPGRGGFPPPNNPLKEGEGNEHLKSLRETLGK
jgi:hypothetical protein